MSHNATEIPQVDPTPIFELFRGSYGSHLLVAASGHFKVFDRLSRKALTIDELGDALDLTRRATVVLVTALRAMKLIALDEAGRLNLTKLAAEHLVSGGAFDVSDYLGQAVDAPGVKEMVERLRTSRPAGADKEEGAAFIYREGEKSAMEKPDLAVRISLILAGRAKNVAPVLAQRINMSGVETLLDIGGGTGIYSIALVAANPNLRAIIMDRPNVLTVARQFAEDYGVADRIDLHAGDFFVDPLPAAPVMLLSNILHDWDVPQCLAIIKRCAAALPANGRLLIHDVFLNDAHDGPLPIALYSAALFTLTEGRAYSEAEYKSWMQAAGLRVGGRVETLVHCGVLTGTKGE
ncbi:MAG: methyltransferase [Planctomycetes bacterium]|nr:methyltransferase [Planctomycetota bacterium]